MSTDAKVRIVGENATQAAFRSVVADANKLGNSLRSVFTRTFAGVAVGGALVAAVKGAIDYGDEIGKAADKAGIAAGAMSELAYAAKQSDIDIGSLSTALKAMQVALAGGGQAFKAVGVDVEKLRAMQPDQQFEIIAEAISRIKDPAQRAQAAVQGFGRAGADLLPLLTQGAAGVRALRDEAKQIGAALSDQDVQRLQGADDAIKKMKGSVGGLANAFTALLAPAIAASADGLRRVFGGSTELERITTRLDVLRTQQEQISQGSLFVYQPEEIAKVNAEATQLQATLDRLRFGTGTGARGGARRWQDSLMADLIGTPDMAASAVSAGFDAAKAAGLRLRAQLKQSMRELEEGGQWLEQHQRQIEQDEQLTQTSTEKQVKAWEDFYAALNRLREQDAIDADTYNRRYAEQLDEVLSEVQVTAKPIESKVRDIGMAFDPIADAADRAAGRMYGVFEDFFFDPMDQGFDGLLRGFADTLRRMMAEAASAKLMEALGLGGGGSSGGSGIFGSILGGVLGGLGGGGGGWSGSWSEGYMAGGGSLGFATGGSFKVGGSGGTDSKLVKFRATPGEMVDIRRPGQEGGGGAVTVAPVYNIDARGATQDLVRALPEILARNNDTLKSDIITGIRRGKYAV